MTPKVLEQLKADARRWRAMLQLASYGGEVKGGHVWRFHFIIGPNKNVIDAVDNLIKDKPKPPKAEMVRDDDDLGPIWKCPHCGHAEDADACDCVLADPGCLFCNQCGGEFET